MDMQTRLHAPSSSFWHATAASFSLKGQALKNKLSLDENIQHKHREAPNEQMDKTTWLFEWCKINEERKHSK
jgi:hypothetical protein